MTEPFEAITPDLPSHQDEMAIAHEGTQGTGLPAPDVDNGTDDQAKYC